MAKFDIINLTEIGKYFFQSPAVQVILAIREK